MVKIVSYYGDIKSLRLESTNKDYEDIWLEEKGDFTYIGKVIGKAVEKE